MRAVAVNDTDRGPPLEIIDMDIPQPGANQVLVRIRATALNRTDLRRVQQHFTDDGARHIAGLELAGEVEACGEGVTQPAPGDRVMAMAPNAYAEYALVDARTAIPVPQGLDWAQAATVPTWYQTAHNALVTEGGLASGKSVLITAASAGVGIASIQIASFLNASTIIGTSSSPDKLERLQALGLDVGIAPDDPAFADRVHAATGGNGVDIVIDLVGAGMLGKLLDATANGGTIVSVGRLGGFEDTIDLNKLALKRIRLVGVTFRTLGVDAKVALRDAMLADLGEALSDGRLQPLVDRTFPLEEALAAQEYMSENKHFGKIVLLTD